MIRPVCTLLLCLSVASCAQSPTYDSLEPLTYAQFLPEPDVSANIDQLSNCTHPNDSTLRLNSQEPVTVIVHGCFSSAGRFRSLADVFAFHGQQAVCFSYDDRDSLENSSAQLITAVKELSAVLEEPRISVLGHSQGGLVSRRALAADRSDPLIEANGAEFVLATVSSPFGGIQASAHCGSRPLAWLSLGLVKPICRLITGKKYREIPPNSRFINDPGPLVHALNTHLKVATDESGSCRQHDSRGICVEDDFVFSLDEQRQPALQTDPGLVSVTVKAGHVEIVGDGRSRPEKLIDILQQYGLLDSTPAERQDDFDALLTRLYVSD